MDWLLLPLDPARPHVVDFATGWHGRSMMLAWGVLVPLIVLIARYLKVTPGQDWPARLDNPFWWRCHWIGAGAVTLLSVFALGLILGVAEGGSAHGRAGLAVLALMAVQVWLGLARGSKGGPTARGRDGSLRGDHYDMTPRRVRFERRHKTLGLALLGLGAGALLSGLWQANAPRWMPLVLCAWWLALAIAAGFAQRRGMARDTYQAIWGPDPRHPGNRVAPVGTGIRREQIDVRSD